MRKLLLCCTSLLSALVVLTITACSKKPENTVVVYTALDRGFSEPILKAFEQKTGIKVDVRYDTEADKSVGLVTRLRNEKDRPRCDVFWNNEIVNTMRLKKDGLLAKYEPDSAQTYPETFRDSSNRWTGFAGRARVIIVNTDLVKEGEEPTSIHDFTDPKWKGKCGIARPLAGTTATHAACLFAHWGPEKAKEFFMKMKENDVRIESGNKQVAVNVAAGRLAFGFTDTDDAIIEVEAGKPVKILYADDGEDELGTLFIPNTLSLIEGSPNPENGKKLIEYLLSPEVEIALSKGKSAQIPLNSAVDFEPRVKTPNDIKEMPVDFGKAAEAFDEAASFIREKFVN